MVMGPDSYQQKVTCVFVSKNIKIHVLRGKPHSKSNKKSEENFSEDGVK
jgi:hypothetical protein